MVILQAGIQKSENLWLYKILRLIAQHTGLEHRSFIQNHPIYQRAQEWELLFTGQANMDFLNIESHGCYLRLGTVFREPIRDIDDYIRQCSHVWTHSPICQRSFDVLPKFDKIVYIIRDARDVAISMSKFVFTPHVLKHHPPQEKDPTTFLVHSLDGELRNWVRHVSGYLKHKEAFGIHFVFYERLLQAFDTEISNLPAYLEITCDSATIHRIKDEVAFGRMHQEDPFHVRKGQSCQWIEELSEEQKREAGRVAGKMLQLLNYPIADNRTNALPGLSAEMSRYQIEQSLAQSRRNAIEEVKRIYTFAMSGRTLRTKIHRIQNWVRQKMKTSVRP